MGIMYHLLGPRRPNLQSVDLCTHDYKVHPSITYFLKYTIYNNY
jgi:hypothetical protein